MYISEYSECRMCGRSCGVDRYQDVGFCNMPAEIYISYYSLHQWEEPIISGTRGSGTIFFAGCSLGCTFCQNRKISRGRNGRAVTENELSDIMLELAGRGAHNINFVTPTHYSPSVRAAVSAARSRGLDIPIVYNTGSYDSVDSLRALEGAVDVYLADLKFHLPKTAVVLASAENYPRLAEDAIDEMVRQAGEPVIEDGLMKRGVIVRILLLPEHTAEAKLILKYLYDRYGDKIYISLMNQYTPMKDVSPPLDRPVTREEYRQLTDYAERLGVSNCFVQEWGTASESFIPDF